MWKQVIIACNQPAPCDTASGKGQDDKINLEGIVLALCTPPLSIVKEEASVQGGKVKNKAKAVFTRRGVGKFPCFETVGDIKFELYIASLSGDRTEQEEVLVAVSKERGMPDYPMDPGGGFPPKALPNVTKSGRKRVVSGEVSGGEKCLLGPKVV